MAKGKPVLEFWQFCEKVLGIKLTPGQRVIAKVAFGNYNPEDLQDHEERQLAVTLFGGLETVEDRLKRFIAMRLGRGSGKTTLCSAFAVYTCVTFDVSLAGPGSIPYVIIIAPDKETAKLSIRMSREMIRGQPALERLLVSDKDQVIQLRRPDGRMVRIEAFAAAKQGNNIRGRDIMAFIFDEAEFLTSNSDGSPDFAVNDVDIFNALKPRLMPNGKGMLISTPWPVETLMGKMFEENFSHPKTALAIKAPTNLVRNEPHIMELVEEELRTDSDNAKREFFCEVEGLTGGEFFDVNALRLALKEGLPFPGTRDPLRPVAIGCDLGFTRDSSAIAVVEFDGSRYNTLYLQEFRPKPGKALRPGDVFKKFALVCEQFGCPGVIADTYYREALKEQLAESSLTVYSAPEGVKGKADVFQRARSVLHEGKVSVPDVEIGRRLIQQAKLVVSKASPGGTVTIKVPRKIGLGHGDLVSAWTLAVHELAYRNLTRTSVSYEPGSEEWHKEIQRRIDAGWSKTQDEYLKKITAEGKKAIGKARYNQLFGGKYHR